MTKAKKIAVGLVVAAGTVWQLNGGEEAPSKTAKQELASVEESFEKAQAPKAKPNSTSAAVAQTAPASKTGVEPSKKSGQAPATPAELNSLSDMSQTLAEYTKPETQLKDLVASLEKSGQAPFVTRNANPDTGEMAIVRTKSPLPGTRYFHAQYFTDESGKPFVQHMSFEFKPGPNAMNEAVDAIKSQFALGEPKMQRGDYMQWKLDDNHILWVKKMAASDLQDDPFNAYTPEDVGTIRVAVEQEVHGDDEDSGEDHQHN